MKIEILIYPTSNGFQKKHIHRNIEIFTSQFCFTD